MARELVAVGFEVDDRWMEELQADEPKLPMPAGGELTAGAGVTAGALACWPEWAAQK